MMPKGDRQTIYKKEPWNHPSQIRIWVKTSVGRLGQFVSPRLHERFEKMKTSQMCA